MSVKIPTQNEEVPRTDQFQKYQTLAITSQAIPVMQDLKVRLQAVENAAYNEDSDLSHLAFLLEEASDELDKLAMLAEAAD